MRLVHFSLLFSLIAGCGGRTSPLAGADASTPSPAACSSLKLRYSVALGDGSRDGSEPVVASDGKRFAVGWYDENRGAARDQRLAHTLLPATARPQDPTWTRTWSVVFGLPPVVAPEPAGGWAALYPTSTLTAGTRYLLGRMSSDIKTVGFQQYLTDPVMDLAFATTPAGEHAALHALPSKVGTLRLLIRDAAGTLKTVDLATGDSYEGLWLASRPGGGYMAGWWGNTAYHIARLRADGALEGKPAAVAPRTSPWEARFALAGQRVGVLYLVKRSGVGEADLLFRLVDLEGKGVSGPHLVASKVTPGTRAIALAWSGKRGRFAAIHDPRRPDLKLSLRLLDELGKPLGAASTLPGCLLTARLPAAAWAGDALAVVHEGGKSGLPDRRICAAVLECAAP